MKFQPADAYAPEAPELSPARQRLIELNTARAASKATVEELQSRLNRLGALKAAVTPLEAELQALDAAEAAALAEWSASPDAPAPQPDTAGRADIMNRLQRARQQVAGAELATASVESVLARANARAAELEREVPPAIANILVDEARGLLPSITEAIAALARAQTRYSALRSFLLERAESSRDAAMRSGFFQALEALDRDARIAAENAPPPDVNATLEWRELAAALGDTPILPTPPPVAMFPGMPELDKWN